GGEVAHEAAQVAQRLFDRRLVALVSRGREEPLAGDLLVLRLRDAKARVRHLRVRGAVADEGAEGLDRLGVALVVELAVADARLGGRGEAPVGLRAPDAREGRLRLQAVAAGVVEEGPLVLGARLGAVRELIAPAARAAARALRGALGRAARRHLGVAAASEA